MQVHALYSVAEYLKSIVFTPSFHGQITSLIKKLPTAETNNVDLDIPGSLRRIFALHPKPEWSTEQKQAYELLSGDKFVGQPALNFFEYVAQEAHPGQRRKLADDYNLGYNNFRKNLSNLTQGFSGLNLPQPTLPGEYVTAVFREQFSANTLEDLSKTAGEFQKYLDLLAEVTDERTEGYEVVRLERGSTIIAVSASVAILAALVTTLRHGLGIANEILTLRGHIESIQESPIGTAEIVASLEANAKDAESSKVETAVADLMEKHCPIKDSADRNEARSRARRVLEKTRKMLIRGVRIYPHLSHQPVELLDGKDGLDIELELQGLYEQLDDAHSATVVAFLVNEEE